MKPRERVPRERLTDVLVAMGAVDRSLLERAAAEFYDCKYGEWLVEQGLITEEVLTIALARQAADAGEFDAASAQLAEASERLHDRAIRHIEGIGGAISRLTSLGRTP